MAFDLRKMCIILAASQPLKTSFHGIRLAQNLALSSACTTLTGAEDRLRLNNAQIKINLDNFGCVFGLHYLCTLKK